MHDITDSFKSVTDLKRALDDALIATATSSELKHLTTPGNFQSLTPEGAALLETCQWKRSTRVIAEFGGVKTPFNSCSANVVATYLWPGES